MPKIEETCEVTINGKVFRDWDSVTATASSNPVVRMVTLSVTEKVGANGSVGQALQIKPGDSATVKLAGVLFASGHIHERQVAYDANNHSVRVTFASQVLKAVRQSIPLKDGEFKGYSFQAIANKALAPVGIALKTLNPPAGWDKAFKYVNIEPGETIFNLLSRLSKYRGIWLRDDRNGNLVAQGNSDKKPTAEFVEGRNILSASCLAQNAPDTSIAVTGQQRGSDNSTPAQNRGAYYGKADAKGSNYSTDKQIQADIPADSDDLKQAAGYCQLLSLSQQVIVRIVYQGWLLSTGNLPEVFDQISIDSPMLMLKTSDLQIADVTFTQDQAGTRTTLIAQKWLTSPVSVQSAPTEQTDAQKATSTPITPTPPTMDGPKGQESIL
ncbi:phage baseplate assembly protein [Rhizobium sp. 11_C7_N12_5]|uniref:phage baseplate assembly protein n=1 Tax=Rhizobium sp. 11_C7_N12_5 TaxID=3240770 RepID=UPI003F25C09D